jgi:hypothetical protein
MTTGHGATYWLIPRAARASFKLRIWFALCGCRVSGTPRFHARRSDRLATSESYRSPESLSITIATRPFEGSVSLVSPQNASTEGRWLRQFTQARDIKPRTAGFGKSRLRRGNQPTRPAVTYAPLRPLDTVFLLWVYYCRFRMRRFLHVSALGNPATRLPCSTWCTCGGQPTRLTQRRSSRPDFGPRLFGCGDRHSRLLARLL